MDGGQSDQGNIDDLNDDTFGDGAVGKFDLDIFVIAAPSYNVSYDLLFTIVFAVVSSYSQLYFIARLNSHSIKSIESILMNHVMGHDIH